MLQLEAAPVKFAETFVCGAQLLGVGGVQLHFLLVLLLRLLHLVLQVLPLALQHRQLLRGIPEFLLPVQLGSLQLHIGRFHLAFETQDLAPGLIQTHSQLIGFHLVSLRVFLYLLTFLLKLCLQRVHFLLQTFLFRLGLTELCGLLGQELLPGLHRLPMLFLPFCHLCQSDVTSLFRIQELIHDVLRTIQLSLSLRHHLCRAPSAAPQLDLPLGGRQLGLQLDNLFLLRELSSLGRLLPAFSQCGLQSLHVLLTLLG
mmetsp:Transcript_29879/g.48288  ORF Transcript_29879/g.48288 Transcript_29879/m.48288 type:complete len:257 (-) Transcript_29879:442-1212(-)